MPRRLCAKSRSFSVVEQQHHAVPVSEVILRGLVHSFVHHRVPRSSAQKP